MDRAAHGVAHSIDDATSSFIDSVTHSENHKSEGAHRSEVGASAPALTASDAIGSEATTETNNQVLGVVEAIGRIVSMEGPARPQDMAEKDQGQNDGNADEQ